MLHTCICISSYGAAHQIETFALYIWFCINFSINGENL